MKLINKILQAFLAAIVITSCTSNQGLREVFLKSESNTKLVQELISGSNEYLIKEVDTDIFNGKAKVFSFRNYDPGTHPTEIIYAVEGNKAYNLTGNLQQLNKLLDRYDLLHEDFLDLHAAKDAYRFIKETDTLNKVIDAKVESKDLLTSDASSLVEKIKLNPNCFLSLEDSNLLKVCYFLSDGISFQKNILMEDANKHTLF